jgi:hypothetical protein
VHNGSDGACGTTPAEPTPISSSAAAGSGGLAGGMPVALQALPYRGPFAVVAHVLSVRDGHVYRRRRAPRLLSGVVAAHTPVTSVSLSLRRTYRGRCLAYSALRAEFRRARCGTAPPFQVARGASFSYLLPEALRPGRYVLDISASDAAGNRTALARGTSRVVFYVS